MGLFRKNKQPDKNIVETVYDIHTQLENARYNLARRKQEELERNNLCASMRQEINKISEECEILRKKNEKRLRKVLMLCFLFLLLGIGVNVGILYYANSERKEYAERLEQEYNAKRADIEQKLSEEQP